jgi:transcriptional regulator with XRE-family HTH domain
MHPYYKRLGARVKAARDAKGWTQQELADRSDLSSAFISYLENGNRPGSFETFLKLADALSLEPELLLAGKAPTATKGKPGFPSLSLEGLTAGEGQIVVQVARSLRRKKKR